MRTSFILRFSLAIVTAATQDVGQLPPKPHELPQLHPNPTVQPSPDVLIKALRDQGLQTQVQLNSYDPETSQTGSNPSTENVFRSAPNSDVVSEALSNPPEQNGSPPDRSKFPVGPSQGPEVLQEAGIIDVLIPFLKPKSLQFEALLKPTRPQSEIPVQPIPNYELQVSHTIKNPNIKLLYSLANPMPDISPQESQAIPVSNDSPQESQPNTQPSEVIIIPNITPQQSQAILIPNIRPQSSYVIPARNKDSQPVSVTDNEPQASQDSSTSTIKPQQSQTDSHGTTLKEEQVQGLQSSSCTEPTCSTRCRYGTEIAKNAIGCDECMCKSRPSCSPDPACVSTASCPYGIKRINGCLSPACECNSNMCPPLSCNAKSCTRGFAKDERGFGCPTCECKRQTSSLACRQLACLSTLTCPLGSMVDKVRGCPICRCTAAVVCAQLTCTGSPCLNGNVESGGCPTCECQPAPVVCPVVHCQREQCTEGFAADSRGCPTCACRAPSQIASRRQASRRQSSRRQPSRRQSSRGRSSRGRSLTP